GACFMNKTAFYDRLSDAYFVPQLLAGARQTFDDESFLSVEYLFQGDGYGRGQYQDVVSGLDLVGQAAMLGFNTGGSVNPFAPPSTDAVPSRFAFVPNVQHYLFISYNKPRIRDDFTLQMTMIANLQDLSTLWSPQVLWSTTEWLQLSLIGFVPIPGPDALAATAQSTGKRYSEYGSFPQLF